MSGISCRRRRLGFEGLERRDLMAGNVTAGINVNGDLFITGDLEDNHVAVYRGFFGQIIVAGGTSNGQSSGNTLVNGSANAQAFNTTGGLVANMSGGDDLVLVTNFNLQRNINASMGAGNDMFALESTGGGASTFTQNGNVTFQYGKITVAGSVTLFGNDGADTLSLNNATISGSLLYEAGVGNDSVVQFGSTPSQNLVRGDVFIRGDTGDDSVSVRRMEVRGNFTINDGPAVTGSTVSLVSLKVTRDLQLFLTIFADNVLLQGEDTSTNQFRGRNVAIFTGNGRDVVNVTNGAATNLRVDTGAEDDGNGFFGIQVTNVVVSNQLVVDSGDGFDNALVENVTANQLTVQTRGGSDGLIVRNVDVVDALFDTFDFNDVVGLYDSIYDFLSVRLGDGNDQLYAGGLTVNVSANFNGGTGANFYNDRGGNFYARLTRQNI